jgi:hypothetical protein
MASAIGADCFLIAFGGAHKSKNKSSTNGLMVRFHSEGLFLRVPRTKILIEKV